VRLVVDRQDDIELERVSKIDLEDATCRRAARLD
jgi:hypothetical protein